MNGRCLIQADETGGEAVPDRGREPGCAAAIVAARSALPPRFVFVDLETTGARVMQDEITEIAILRVEGGRELGRWQTLVRPGQSIPPFSVQLACPARHRAMGDIEALWRFVRLVEGDFPPVSLAGALERVMRVRKTREAAR
jgi:hypothetical protein